MSLSYGYNPMSVKWLCCVFVHAPVCELTSLRAVNWGMWEVCSGRQIEVSSKWLMLITAEMCQVLFECKVPHLKLHMCVEWSSSMLPFDYGNAPCIWGTGLCIARKCVCVCVFLLSVWIGKTCLTSVTADVGDRTGLWVRAHNTNRQGKIVFYWTVEIRNQMGEKKEALKWKWWVAYFCNKLYESTQCYSHEILLNAYFLPIDHFSLKTD